MNKARGKSSPGVSENDVLNFIKSNRLTSDTARKIVNSAIVTPSGMGSPCDMSVGARAFYDQPFTFIEQLRQSEILYYSDWQAEKIINIPVNDMLRKSWLYEGLDEEETKELVRYQDILKTFSKFRQALRLERLHGGSAIFIGIEDEVDNPELPIDYAQLRKGSLRFLNTVPRHRINKVILQTDPTEPNYGEPEHYDINGKQVHRSRLLIFDGDPLLPVRTLTFAANANMRNDGFGPPILMRLFNRLTEATGSRQAAFHLIQRASVILMTGDLQSQASTVEGANNLQILSEIVNQMNNYNAAVIHNIGGNTTDISTLAANFGSIPELILTYLQVLSAASDIPATRFLGQAPGGLNATGASDLENYYNMIASRQRLHIRPNVMKLLSVLLPSVGIDKNLDEVEVLFEPLWNTSQVEEAQIRQSDTQSISTLVSQGIISDDEALQELQLREVLLTNPEDFQSPTRVDADKENTDPRKALQDLKDTLDGVV